MKITIEIPGDDAGQTDTKSYTIEAGQPLDETVATLEAVARHAAKAAGIDATALAEPLGGVLATT